MGTDVPEEDQRLGYGGADLDDASVVRDVLEEEATVFLTCGLDGGAKKRKKKVYTKPKKVPHKHKKVKLAVLKFYKVDGNNKVVRLRKESPVRSRCLHGHALQPVPLRQVRGHVLVRQVRRVQV